jgi:hypothetical protein
LAWDAGNAIVRVASPELGEEIRSTLRANAGYRTATGASGPVPLQEGFLNVDTHNVGEAQEPGESVRKLDLVARLRTLSLDQDLGDLSDL